MSAKKEIFKQLCMSSEFSRIPSSSDEYYAEKLESYIGSLEFSNSLRERYIKQECFYRDYAERMLFKAKEAKENIENIENYINDVLYLRIHDALKRKWDIEDGQGN